MVKVIMHGCNGKMGQTISSLIAADKEIEIVAGIDAVNSGKNDYPVFSSISECTVAADAVIDFSVAAAVDGMLDYCVEKKLPCVLCTTGLSEAQLQKVQEASKQVAVLKSANMSLGINMLLKLLKEAAKTLSLQVLISRSWKSTITRSWTRQAARRLRWRIPSMRRWGTVSNMSMTEVRSGRRGTRRRSVSARSGVARLWVTMMWSLRVRTRWLLFPTERIRRLFLEKEPFRRQNSSQENLRDYMIWLM